MKLLDYIGGLRKGKEAHRLEKESMKDLFFADALDGFHQTDGDSELRIELLRKQVATRSAKKRNRHIITWSIAACLVLGVGISSYLLFMKKDKMADALIALETASLPKKPSNATVAEEMLKANADTVTVRNESATPKIDIHNAITKVQQSSKQMDLIIGEEKETFDLADFKVVSVQDNEVAEDTSTATITNELVTNTSVDIPADTSQMKLIAMNESNARLEEVAVASFSKQKRTVHEKDDDTASPRAKIGKFIISEPVIGKKEYRKYLREQLIHPKDEKCRNVRGEVIVTFYVDANGKPRKITITKSLCKSADEEAIRLIQKGPKWTVGHLPVELKVRF